MANKKEKVIKLDLGCGAATKKPGFISVDARAELKPDIVLDLKKPWPWKAGSVSEVHCSLFLQYLTGPERVDFMNKLYDILAPGAQATIVVPHAQSAHAFMDPYVQWPPMNEGSFLFFNAEWRKANRVPHTDIRADFDFGYGFAFQNGWHLKAEEARNFALVNYNNVCSVIQVTLTRRP